MAAVRISVRLADALVQVGMPNEGKWFDLSKKEQAALLLDRLGVNAEKVSCEMLAEAERAAEIISDKYGAEMDRRRRAREEEIKRKLHRRPVLSLAQREEIEAERTIISKERRARLAQRDIEILRRYQAGETTREIGEVLCLTRQTVSIRIKRLLKSNPTKYVMRKNLGRIDASETTDPPRGEWMEFEAACGVWEERVNGRLG